jgi:hypothetical protein
MNELDLGLHPKEISDYFAIVDPYGIDRVTYSDIIYLLTTQQVQGEQFAGSKASLQLDV